MVGLLNAPLTSMKNSIQILVYAFIYIVLESCYTSGYQTIKGGYFPSHGYNKDTIISYQLMIEMGEENPEIKFDSVEIIKYLEDAKFPTGKDTLLRNPSSWYPYVNWAGLHTWYIKSQKRDLVFALGLYADGFALSSVCTLKEGKREYCFGDYELKSLQKQGKELRKEYITRFETEIIPLMKPYFGVQEAKKR